MSRASAESALGCVAMNVRVAVLNETALLTVASVIARSGVLK